MRVKCLAQEHNIVSPARARTRTARSGNERTNHEATAPPHSSVKQMIFSSFELGDITKHSITGPSGNSEFCFPSILNVEGLMQSGKRNSLWGQSLSA